MKTLIRWLEQHQAACSWKHYFGIECPGCGMQTAFIELLKGNLAESLRVFPALLPMIAMILFTFLHLVFNFPKGALIIKILFIFTTSILVTGYIIKIITH